MKAIYLNFNFKQFKFVTKRKTTFSNPNNPMRDKINTEGPIFFLKFGMIVASAIGSPFTNPQELTEINLSLSNLFYICFGKSSY